MYIVHDIDSHNDNMGSRTTPRILQIPPELFARVWDSLQARGNPPVSCRDQHSFVLTCKDVRDVAKSRIVCHRIRINTTEPSTVIDDVLDGLDSFPKDCTLKVLHILLDITAQRLIPDLLSNMVVHRHSSTKLSNLETLDLCGSLVSATTLLKMH